MNSFGVMMAGKSNHNASPRLSAADSAENIYSTLNAMHFGAMIVGLDRIIRNINPPALTLMGYDNFDEVKGQLGHEFVCPAERNNCPVLDKLETVDHSERILLRKEGSRLPILKSVVPIMLEGEEVFFEVFGDISELFEVQAELETYPDRLEQRVAERTKELEERNRELEKYHDLFVQREIRIKEL